MKGRKRAFVEAYVSDVKRNQTQAAIKAGYSEKTAAQQASRLMNDEEVKAAIEEMEKELHEQNTAQANEVVEFLTSVMRGESVDHIPLLVGDGVQKLTEGIPSAKERLKAAEMLGKHYGLFTERTQLDIDGAVQIIDDIPRGEDIAKPD